MTRRCGTRLYWLCGLCENLTIPVVKTFSHEGEDCLAWREQYRKGGAA